MNNFKIFLKQLEINKFFVKYFIVNPSKIPQKS